MNILFPKNNKSHVEIISKQFQVNYHTVFLDENIVEPSEYRDLISLLLNASELDTIDMIINNGGGQLNAAKAVIEAIKNADGNVKATILGDCHSAASMIALSCPEIVVLDSAEMMVHQASWGLGGTGNNVKAQNDFYYRQCTKLVKDVYKGFMTEKEIEQVLTGTEFWFDADEIRTRIERRNKSVKKEKTKGA